MSVFKTLIIAATVSTAAYSAQATENVPWDSEKTAYSIDGVTWLCSAQQGIVFMMVKSGHHLIVSKSGDRLSYGYHGQNQESGATGDWIRFRNHALRKAGFSTRAWRRTSPNTCFGS